MRACFLFPFQNISKMWVHAEADCFWLIWPPFSGWLQKFCNTDIVSLASPRVILEPHSAVFSVCQNRYQKLVFCWEVFFDRCTNCKFINWYPDMTIWILVQCTVFFDWKEFEILSHRQAFLESTEISASEELNALEKVPAQFMAFRKLSGKCHFLFSVLHE